MRKMHSKHDDILKQAQGVVHVGAHLGQERELYAARSLPVLWVEAQQDKYDRLCELLASYPQQTAVRALLADREGIDFTFHISSNNGASSSIFDFAGHRKLWPHVEWTAEQVIRSTTLDVLLRQHAASGVMDDCLVMDVQGAELLVLQGAAVSLSRFHTIKLEASDFEAYAGGCTLDEVTVYLEAHGFALVDKKAFETMQGVGTYYDAVFRQA